MSFQQRCLAPIVAALAALILIAPGVGWAQVYCNITKIEAKPLTNGVQTPVV